MQKFTYIIYSFQFLSFWCMKIHDTRRISPYSPYRLSYLVLHKCSKFTDHLLPEYSKYINIYHCSGWVMTIFNIKYIPYRVKYNSINLLGNKRTQALKIIRSSVRKVYTLVNHCTILKSQQCHLKHT